MEVQTHQTDPAGLVASTAMLAGTLILENGGETYRAEETANRVCLTGGIASPAVLALPTGIFLSGNQNTPDQQHGVTRVHHSAVHLYKLERTNFYCRAYASGDIDIETLNRSLTELRASHQSYPLPLALLIAGLTPAAFSLMLGGGLHDVWITFACVLLLTLIKAPLKKSATSTVTVNFAGGILISASALLLTHLIGGGNPDVIIVAGIIPLLPGLATLNAVRDAMHGDLVSGCARLLKALLIALSLAAGVGATLAVYLSFGGAL